MKQLPEFENIFNLKKKAIVGANPTEISLNYQKHTLIYFEVWLAYFELKFGGEPSLLMRNMVVFFLSRFLPRHFSQSYPASPFIINNCFLAFLLDYLKLVTLD